jgi:hypothetical protein
MTVVAIVVANLSRSAHPDEKEAKAIIDKAITAIGGEEKLSNARIITWKSKVKSTFDGKQGQLSVVTTVRGLDQFRTEIEGESDGLKFAATTVVNGAKGWRRFGDLRSEMDPEELANEKHGIFLAVAIATLVPINRKGFKVESFGAEGAERKQIVGIKVTAPDAKEFSLFFDKESSLPVKQISISKFRNEELTHETTFASYKEFAGIKIATKVEHKLGRITSLSEEITDFRVLNSVPETFPEAE